MTWESGQVEVSICPDGPMLVRGAAWVRGPEGEAYEVERPVVAVCRCDGSRAWPWCDGTHKLLDGRRGKQAVEQPQE